MVSKKHIKAVRLFMSCAGQEVPKWPSMPAGATRRLRAKLILEEALETVEALGFCVVVEAKDKQTYVTKESAWLVDYDQLGSPQKPDLVQIADGVADMIVVATGTALACGIDPKPIQTAVDQSNLAKFGPGGRRREDGKWLKPDDWRPPDIARLLRDQGMQS